VFGRESLAECGNGKRNKKSQHKPASAKSFAIHSDAHGQPPVKAQVAAEQRQRQLERAALGLDRNSVIH
jgi:hypothetical protein